MLAKGAGVPSVGSLRREHYQVAEKVLHDVIPSEARNLAFKRINYLRDTSSPSASQDDATVPFSVTC